MEGTNTSTASMTILRPSSNWTAEGHPSSWLHQPRPGYAPGQRQVLWARVPGALHVFIACILAFACLHVCCLAISALRTYEQAVKSAYFYFGNVWVECRKMLWLWSEVIDDSLGSWTTISTYHLNFIERYKLINCVIFLLFSPSATSLWPHMTSPSCHTIRPRTDLPTSSHVSY